MFTKILYNKRSLAILALVGLFLLPLMVALFSSGGRAAAQSLMIPNTPVIASGPMPNYLYHNAFPKNYLETNATLSLQNVSNSAATAQLTFLNGEGGTIVLPPVEIPPKGVEIFIAEEAELLEEGFHSLVVSADQPLESVVHIRRQNPAGDQVAAYRGVSSGSTSERLGPYYGVNAEQTTTIILLNAGEQVAIETSINYYTMEGELAFTETIASIPLATPYVLPSPPGLPNDFVGWVAITSDQPVIGLLEISDNNNFEYYNALGDGSTQTDLPRYVTYSTILFVSNPTSNSAQFTLRLYHGGVYYDYNGTLSAFAATFVDSSLFFPGPGVITGITLYSDQPILLGEQTPPHYSTFYSLATYGSEVGTIVGLPRVTHTETAFSYFYIQNTGETTAGIQIFYYDLSGALLHTDSITLASKRQAAFGLEELGEDFEGSALITSDQPIRVWVDEHIAVPPLEATLAINYNTGAPGSYFTLTGSNFPPDDTATISVNRVTLGTVLTDGNGSLSFLLATTNADEGAYFVTTSVNPSATVQFVLAANQPTRPQEGSGVVFNVPAGIALTEYVYLPLVKRE